MTRAGSIFFAVCLAVATSSCSSSAVLSVPPLAELPVPPDPRLYRPINPTTLLPELCDSQPCIAEPREFAEHLWAFAVDAGKVTEYMVEHLARRDAAWIDVVNSSQAQRDAFATALDDASVEPLIPAWAWVAMGSAVALALGFVVGAQLGGSGVIVIDGGAQ